MKTDDLIGLAEKILVQTEDQLIALRQSTDAPLTQIIKARSALEESLHALRNILTNHNFNNPADEIRFFKEIKPVLLSQYLYYDSLFLIHLNIPASGKARRRYLQKHITRQQEKLQQQPEFYRYCLAGHTRLDNVYFLRSNESSPTILGHDRIFSTGYDEILATFLSAQLLTEYLQQRLIAGQNEGSYPKLTWTASKTDLVELIYALNTAEVFNNGQADMIQIAKAVEQVFNINLGHIYKTFQEIRRRKTVQATFIQSLLLKFQKYLSDMDK